MSSNSTTKRCTKCGIEYPATFEFFSWHRKQYKELASCCRECARKQARKWKSENREKVKQARARHYLHYKEQEKQDSKIWQDTNRERMHIKNRLWIKQNPIKVAAIRARRKNKKKNLPSTFTQRDWELALDYFDHRCAVCGRQPTAHHGLAKDHWIPVDLGGGYTPDNIVPLCHPFKNGIGGCNAEKKAKHPRKWLIEKYDETKADDIIEQIETYFEWRANLPEAI